VDSALIVLIVTVPSAFAAVTGLVLATAKGNWALSLLGFGLAGLLLGRFYYDLVYWSMGLLVMGILLSIYNVRTKK